MSLHSPPSPTSAAAAVTVAVFPASTKTGRAAIATLLSDLRAPSVRAYYRDLAKVPAEFASKPKFEAVKIESDDSDASSPDFEGADCVLFITPPCLDDNRDSVEDARRLAMRVKEGVMRSRSVKRVVYLSSMGAEFEAGVGEIKTNYVTEHILADSAFEVVFIRCAYFMENWAAAVPTVRESGFFESTITPLDWKIPMVSVPDIAQATVHVLLAQFSGAGRRGEPTIFDLHGPRSYSAQDVQAAFAAASGKDVEVRPVPPDQLASHFVSRLRVPINKVPDYVEMTRSILPGGLMKDEVQYAQGENVRRGDRELVEVVKDMWTREGEEVTGKVTELPLRSSIACAGNEMKQGEMGSSHIPVL